MKKSPSHQLTINNQKSSGKSSRSPSSPQNNNSVPYDDQFLDVMNFQFQKLLYQNSPSSSSSPSPLPMNTIENLMTRTPPSKSPQTAGYNHSQAGEEDVIVMDGFLVTSSTSSPSLDGSSGGGKRSFSKSSSGSPVRPWENKKERAPYGSRFQPSPTWLGSPVASSSLSPHSMQEKESWKPTLVTSSTPPSSLYVSNRSGGKPPVSKSSSSGSLGQLLQSINKDSLYDSRYQPSPTSLSSQPPSSSPSLRQVRENLKPTASLTSSGYSPTNSSRGSSDQVVCKYYIGTNSCRYGSKCRFFHPNGSVNRSASSSLASAPMMIPSDQQVFSATTVPMVYLTSSNHITQPREAPLSAVQTTSGVTNWTPLDDEIINTADIPTSANPLASSTLEAHIDGVLYGPQERLRGRRLPVFNEICPAE